MPFDFVYFGELFGAGAPLRVTTNGWASFTDTSAAFQHLFAAPNPALPKNMLAPFFFDQRIAAGGNVYVRTVGAQPNRQLVVQWEAMTSAAGPSERYAYQLVLYEESHDIKLQYRNTQLLDGNPANDRPGGATALIGIQNADGSDGVQFSRNTYQLGLEPGGRTIVFQPQPAGGYAMLAGLKQLHVANTTAPAGSSLASYTPITLTFSRALDLSSAVAGSTVYIRNETQAVNLPVTLSFPGGNKDQITIAPQAPFSPGDQYTVNVTTGLRDTDGGPLSQDPLGLSCGNNSPTAYSSVFWPLPSVAYTVNFGGRNPYAIALEAGGSMWVTEVNNDELLELNPSSRAWLGTTWLGGGANSPEGLALTANRAYVANRGSNDTNRADIGPTPALDMGNVNFGNCNEPTDVAINSSQTRAYYACSNNDRVAAFDLATFTQCDLNGALPGAELDPVGASRARGIATRPGDDTWYFFVSDNQFLRIQAGPCDGFTSDVATATNIGGSEPWDVVATTTRAYVTQNGGSDRLVVMNADPVSPSFGQWVASLNFGGGTNPRLMALNANASVLGVALNGSDDLSLIRTSNNTEIVRVPLDGAGCWDAVGVAAVDLGGGRTQWWVTCPNDNRIVIVQ
ncbi:MAG: Ig-like domain-containing protein [Deltaproteobacteria bacterium]|nr:Ig-like domain-containing protein [Deltaproteobacteria bacterium]